MTRLGRSVQSYSLLMRNNEHLNCNNNETRSLRQLPADVVECCVAAALSHPHVSRRAATRWLRGSRAGAALAAAVTRLLPNARGPLDGTHVAEPEHANQLPEDVSAEVSKADTAAMQLFSAAITGGTIANLIVYVKAGRVGRKCHGHSVRKYKQCDRDGFHRVCQNFEEKLRYNEISAILPNLYIMSFCYFDNDLPSAIR